MVQHASPAHMNCSPRVTWRVLSVEAVQPPFEGTPTRYYGAPTHDFRSIWSSASYQMSCVL